MSFAATMAEALEPEQACPTTARGGIIALGAGCREDRTHVGRAQVWRSVTVSATGGVRHQAHDEYAHRTCAMGLVMKRTRGAEFSHDGVQG